MPSTTDRQAVQVGLAAISVLVLAYSLVIVQQLLLGAATVVFCWLVYLLWRFLSVFERIATALEHRVTQHEHRRRRERDSVDPRADSPDRGREREGEPDR